MFQFIFLLHLIAERHADPIRKSKYSIPAKKWTKRNSISGEKI